MTRARRALLKTVISLAGVAGAACSSSDEGGGASDAGGAGGAGVHAGSDASGVGGDATVAADGGAANGDGGGSTADSGAPPDGGATGDGGGDGGGGGTIAGMCSRDASSWVSSSTGGDAYDYKVFGNYVVQADNWNGLPDQSTFANSADCWGITDSEMTNGCCINSYPHTTRGWFALGALATLSTAGTNDWTTRSGMGIAIPALTKAKLHWAFSAPAAGASSRWDALEDVYFHKTATPDASQFPPVVDLQIIQALADQVVNDSTYYALVAQGDHATTVTLGGTQYLIYVDDGGAASFHSSGGHTITMFTLPTAFTSKNANPTWGKMDAVTDIDAIVHYLAQANPVDDAKKPLLDAAGTAITSPLLTADEFLTAVNAGWEVDIGTPFTSSAACLAMQAEADCP